MTCPTGALISGVGYYSNSGTSINILNPQRSVNTATMGVTITTVTFAIIFGVYVVEMGSTAGNISLQLKTSDSGNSAVGTVRTGFYMTIEQVI